MKCKGNFKSKSITRMIKNIMELVILECKVCKSEISLIDYPKHIIQCEEDNKIVHCPICIPTKNCKLKYGDINNSGIDIANIPGIGQQIIDNIRVNKVLNLTLQDKNKDLLEEFEKLKKENAQLNTRLEILNPQVISPVKKTSGLHRTDSSVISVNYITLCLFLRIK